MTTTEPLRHDGMAKVIEEGMLALRRIYGPESIPVSNEQVVKACEADGFKDKVVVVTGGSKGLGAEFAKKAASYGAKLVIGARNQKNLDDIVAEITAAEGKATSHVLDVSDWDSQVAFFDYAVATYGRIDKVIANAGVFLEPPLLDDVLGEAGKLVKPNLSTIDINVIGGIYTSKLAFHHLKKSLTTKEEKSLVILGSLTSFRGTDGVPLYVASKHALLGLFRALHLESKGELSVSFVTPGPCITEIFGPLIEMIKTLPHCSTDDAVGAMLYAASAPDVGGSTFAIDTQGIFRLPFLQGYHPESTQ